MVRNTLVERDRWEALAFDSVFQESIVERRWASLDFLLEYSDLPSALTRVDPLHLC